MVKYLRHTEIDRTRWDLCIENASFETLYPYSWYLDLVSNDWEGLVKGDYEMVMPLTRTKKFGFNFLLQPILAQQLGIFSKNQPDSSEIIDFIEAVEAANKNDCSLIVHCDAGVSRSGAVASWVVDYLELPYLLFKEDNPSLHPNVFIYTTLRRLSGMNKFFST